MNKILLLIVLSLFLTGCGITARVVEEIEEQPTQEEKDLMILDKALSEKDASICYPIQDQPTREKCFTLRPETEIACNPGFFASLSEAGVR